MTDDIDIERLLAKRAARYVDNRAVIDVKHILPALRAEGYEVVRRGEVPDWMHEMHHVLIDGRPITWDEPVNLYWASATETIGGAT